MKKFIPLIFILIFFGLFFLFDLEKYISFAQLQSRHHDLQLWTDQHFIKASLVYIFIYILVVAISVPGATVLTLIGGFLFGLILGSFYVVTSATIGATIIFLATKTALADWFSKKASVSIKHFEAGFQKNALSYLLFLRLIPLFPFWLINIVSALLNVRLRTFITATFFGIIPGTMIYVSLGSGLGNLFALNETPDLSLIFKPFILLPLLALALLSLAPLIYKRWKDQHHG